MSSAKFLRRYRTDSDVHFEVESILNIPPCQRRVGGVHVDFSDPGQDMLDMAEFYSKNTKERILHILINFKHSECTDIDVLERIAQRICHDIGKRYQVIYAVHLEDPKQPHIHIIFNMVSFRGGMLYCHQYDWERIQYYIHMAILPTDIRLPKLQK